MNEFDIKASGWDNNPMHWDRSKAIAQKMISSLPLNQNMVALEFGAGTGILSFMLKDNLKEITLMDTSQEMVKITDEKIQKTNTKNLTTLNYNLELNDFAEKRFDLIFTQMVLHHVEDIKTIIVRFAKMLRPEGYLAIADLYKEDGSFHGEGFTGHNGFDPEALAAILQQNGFVTMNHSECFVVKRELPDGTVNQFPVFLLSAHL